MEQRAIKYAIASLVIGLASLPLYYLGIGIIAVILAVMSLVRVGDTLYTEKWMAALGLVFGIGGTILFILQVMAYIATKVG